MKNGCFTTPFPSILKSGCLGFVFVAPFGEYVFFPTILRKSKLTLPNAGMKLQNAVLENAIPVQRGDFLGSMLVFGRVLGLTQTKPMVR